ncbi:MAG TPA: DUF6644 family protein [Mycoplana sp.]|nr:DUF6644 family protein [Mycoplana sp.]
MQGLEWIAATPIAAALKAWGTLYLFVNAAHILSIGLIVGAILPLDLRLLGLFRSHPLSVLGPYLSASAAIGVALAIATGICLFSVRPMEYAANPAFLTKLVLLACGVLNALSVHGTTRWMTAVNLGKVSPLLRLQAFLSLTLWVATLVAGRWIAFV